MTFILTVFLFSLGRSGWSGCMVKRCREQWSLLFIQSHMCSCHSFFIVIEFQWGMLLHIDFLPSKILNVPNVPSSVPQSSKNQELLKISYIIWIKIHHSVPMFPRFYKCKHCSLLWVSPTYRILVLWRLTSAPHPQLKIVPNKFTITPGWVTFAKNSSAQLFYEIVSQSLKVKVCLCDFFLIFTFWLEKVVGRLYESWSTIHT